MSNKTTNLNLDKPVVSDVIGDTLIQISNNFDKVDTEITNLKSKFVSYDNKFINYDTVYNSISDSLDFIDKNTGNVIKRLYRNGDLKIVGELYEVTVMKYGFDYTKTDTTQTDWATGTLTNVSATSGGDLILGVYTNLIQNGSFETPLGSEWTLVATNSPATQVVERLSVPTNDGSYVLHVKEYDGTKNGSVSAKQIVSGGFNTFDTLKFDVQPLSAEMVAPYNVRIVITVGAISVAYYLYNNGFALTPSATIKDYTSGTSANAWNTKTLPIKQDLINAGVTWSNVASMTIDLLVSGGAAAAGAGAYFDNLSLLTLSSSGTRLSTYPLDSVKVAKSATIGWTINVGNPSTYTTNQCTGGTAIASSSQSIYPANRAFDGSSTTSWTSNTLTGSWIGYDFGVGVTKNIRRISANITNASQRLITSMKFQYSDDATTWYDATTITTVTSASAQIFDVPNCGSHRYWRLLQNSTSNTMEMEMYELEMYEVATYTGIVKIETSLDGTTYTTATNGGAIAGITDGLDVKGKTLYVRQTLSTTDTTVTPRLNDMTINVLSKEG